MRRAGRVDSNHRLVVAAFRLWGCSVVSLANMGSGVPDIIVGYRGFNHLVEIKTRTGRLTADQVAFHAAWEGNVLVVRGADEADELVEEWGLSDDEFND